MANPNLEENILIEIFSRLPTKSVGKFRCLSKTWKTNLSTSYFVNSHLINKPNKHSLILISRLSQTLHSITSLSKNNAVWSDFDLGKLWTNVLGSCKGLVLLLSYDKELVLINPVTLQQVTIPSLIIERHQMPPIYGFGYDSCADDYKIVAICDKGKPGKRALVRVYSVKSGVWKTVNDDSPYQYIDIAPRSGTFLNGTVHFSAYEAKTKRAVVAAFGLANEVFNEIVTPFSKGGLQAYKLTTTFCVLGGCLGLVARNGLTMDLWMMKEYGLVESWTKLISVGINYGQIVLFKPLCFIGDEIVSLFKGRVVVFSLGNGKIKYEVDEYDTECVGLAFEDTLVSPILA